MGMDGLSIANTGAVKESTSAELTARTEQAMQADPANSSRQVQSLSTNRRIREKQEDEEREDRQRQEEALEHDKQNPRDEVFQDGLEEPAEEEEEEESVDVQDIENPNKDFYVKLNVKDDIIELYDSATDRLIETISGNELGELVQKLNMASGIFINKKV